MDVVLRVTLPFFALVLIGWLAARFRMTPPGSVPALNAFVLYFALPCMLLRLVMATPIGALFDPVLIAVYGVVATLIVVVAFRTEVRTGTPRKDAAFGALVAAFPNSGFMGVPLVVTLLGPTAAGPVICVLLVDMLYTSTLCMGIAHAGAPTAAGQPPAWVGALRGAASNPLSWSVLAGAVLSGLGWSSLPGPVDTVTAMLAAAGTPTALFAIGVALYRPPVHPSLARSSPMAAVPMSVVKLVVHPLLIAGGLFGARAVGAPVPMIAIEAVVLAAALPSAGNVMMLAERNGAEGGRIAWIILLTTSAAFVTFSGLAWWMTGGIRH